ncbi:MAG TPA: alanine dehydrogenase, partial [Microbacterium sp.]|nr:alanine dehydrogenase [Microbacterium sp.]
NATLPYIATIADMGWDAAAEADPALARGLNVRAGVVVNEGVRAAFGM